MLLTGQDRTGQDRTGQDRTGLTFSKLILFTLLFATFAAPGWAEPATHTINSLDDLKALCEVVDNAGQRNYTFDGGKVAAGDVIDFKADIALDHWLRIDQNVTIKGNGHKLTAGAELDNLIQIEKINEEVTVAIDDLTLTNSQGKGMMIYGDVNVKLTNCAFTNNEIDGNGGGLGIANYNEYIPTVTLTNCTFTGNTANVDSDPLSASGQGGGLYVGNAKVTMTNCTFAGNTAEQYGGGLYVEGNSTVTVANCTFTGNTAKGYKANDGTEVPGWGGGLCVMGDAAVTMANCTFAGNTAGYGAEVFMLAYQGVPTLSAANTVFWNSAAGGKYLALAKYGDVAYPTLNLYNCAYAANAVAGLVPGGNNGLVDGNDALQITEIGCVKTLDWSAGHNAVEKEVTVTDDVKMTHTVVLLTAKDTAIIGQGLTAEKVVASDCLNLTGDTANIVKAALKKDQLGHTRNTTPDIGAWEYINVEGVALKSPDVEITVGEEVTLSATVSPDNAVNTDVKWSVSEGADKVALYLGTTKLEDGAVLSRDKQVTVKGLAAGTATVKATSAVDSQKSVICTVTVNKGTPKVTAPTDLTAIYGQTLADVSLPKGWKWNDSNTSVGSVGTHSFPATFTPEDTTNYATITENVSVKVNKAAPDYTVPGNLTAIYGQTLKDVALPNGWTWNDSSQSVGSVGSHSFAATFTPRDTNNYTTVTENVSVTVSPKPDDGGNGDSELTEEQKAAQQKYEQETTDKAQKAEEAARTVDTSTQGGKALADLMSGNAQGSTKATQAAALEVKEALEETGTDLSTLTTRDVEKAVENKQQEREAKVFEAAGQVEDPKVPAATDLLARSDNAALKEANENLTVQPKLVQPEVLSADEAEKAAESIREAANNNNVAKDVDPGAVQAAAQPGAIKTSADITIEPASKDLGDQTKAVEKVFNSVSADLAGANDGNGVVIATVLPKMTPKVPGFFPLRVNLRHLMPGRRLRFWPSAAHFRQVSGSVSVSVASGQDGDFFFLDENGVPTATVSGDASKMTAVAFLTAGTPYEDAFITADATEKDQPALEELAEKATGSDSPTSNKGSGGCDAGLGGVALLALTGLVATRKH